MKNLFPKCWNCCRNSDLKSQPFLANMSADEPSLTQVHISFWGKPTVMSDQVRSINIQQLTTTWYKPKGHSSSISFLWVGWGLVGLHCSSVSLSTQSCFLLCPSTGVDTENSDSESVFRISALLESALLEYGCIYESIPSIGANVFPQIWR